MSLSRVQLLRIIRDYNFRFQLQFRFSSSALIRLHEIFKWNSQWTGHAFFLYLYATDNVQWLVERLPRNMLTINLLNRFWKEYVESTFTIRRKYFANFTCIYFSIPVR